MAKLKVAPLNSSFMAASIIGFIVSIWYVHPYISQSWGFAFTVFFVLMFIASIISMTLSEPEPDHIDSLAVQKLKKK